jgi:hypothetical protein
MNKYSGVKKNPDHMTRTELVKCISAFESFRDAELFWMKWALSKVSKKAFYKARGFE